MKMDTSNMTDIHAAWRRANPERRAPEQFYRRLNTSRRAQEACCYCGATGPTWCNAYRRTKLASDWRLAHVLKCPELPYAEAAGALAAWVGCTCAPDRDCPVHPLPSTVLGGGR